jgi:hypothetical protein
MASVPDVRQALKTALTGITALTSAFPDGYRVSAYPLSNPTPPQIVITEFGILKHQAMNNGAEWWTVGIKAFLAMTTDTISVQTADEFLDNDPISPAIEADGTLGGLVSDLIVDTVDQRYWDSTKGTLAGVEYQVRILV